jgi:hypothetical protein
MIPERGDFMKKLVCIIVFCFVLTTLITGQEKIKYGNIPYGISIEEAIEIYGSIYDSCSEYTSYGFDCRFIDFTALRPMFQNIFGTVTTLSFATTSGWKTFNKNFTRILALREKIDEKRSDETTLYFLHDGIQTKLFMIKRNYGIIEYANMQEIYLANKAAITERLLINPHELSGTYDYYSSGSRSERAYTCIWEKNNERIVLYIANTFSNTGGIAYISNIFFKEYENLYINKRNTEQNAAIESAKEKF